ncbi:MAG: SDR family NAD(P)-dependent oxidoreductase [Bdellovibrionaceae bacterium]|nr:SDR family NAD(P)-dependent oxidoreductase [Pseudobdellovibrionaceae bacterium]
MQTTKNTILITGAGSGIGLALAEEFLKRGHQVLIGSRSAEKLSAAQEKGFKTFVVDMASSDSIKLFAEKLVREVPSLNSVIHNAGIMKNENLLKGSHEKIQEETIKTNLLGPMLLNNFLIPHFLKKDSATIMTVTSGLAYTPLAMTPTYSATKAAIHSYTESLRYQLKDTNIRVQELVPPYVQTGLMGERQLNDPNAMPLKEFIAEVMQILSEKPNATEIVVQRVQPQRFSVNQSADNYQAFFKNFNDRMSLARKSEF